MKFGKKLKIASKKNLIVNQYTMQKYLQVKIKSYNGKITQTSTTIKYQEGSQ